MHKKHDGEAIKNFIRKDPNMSWIFFMKESKWSKIPNSVFRYYRDLVRKESLSNKKTKSNSKNSNIKYVPSRKYRRSSQKIYTSLWSANIEEIGEQGKKALFKLITDLREDKITNWEIVSVIGDNTEEIEIREKTK